MDITRQIIHTKFNLPDANVEMYNNAELRNHISPLIADEINKIIPQISKLHSEEDEIKLKRDGFLVFENYLTTTEAENLKEYVSNFDGYNTHVYKYSDKIGRKYSDDYPFPTLSYTPDVLLSNPKVLSYICDPKILSLVQSYLGCFPTLYSVNSWWHFERGQVYGTQVTHRDYDDFRFLAFFIYLTDVDDERGPHVYYPGTQNGDELKNEVHITGKAGTAILADTFALHRGQQLLKDKRLLCWFRFGLYLNNMHFWDENYRFKVNSGDLFSNIPNTRHNQYLFRAFYE